MTTSTDGILVIHNGRALKLSELSESIKQELLAKLIPYGKEDKAKNPPLNQIYNLESFAPAAKNKLTKETWAYYRTGAADELTLRENRAIWNRVWFRPRILRDVTIVDIKTELLGTQTLPFYITAFAGCGLDGNDEHEIPLVRASNDAKVVYMLPFRSQLGITELSSKGEFDQWLQIYVGKDRSIIVNAIKEAEATGRVKALFFTVDMAQMGKREKQYESMGAEDTKDYTAQITSGLSWEEVSSYMAQTSLKCILKGVQTGEDALTAAELGFHGILLSNHGGRQLDTARSALEVLVEVKSVVKDRKLEIFVDGGVTRGSDVVKALALGATGVGLGRPMLYAMQAYGQEGVARAIKILKDEVEGTMRLLGLKNLSQLGPEHVDISALKNRVTQ